MPVANFIGPKFDELVDRDLFNDVDVLETIQPSDTMAHLLARCGKFKSVGEAKRNGWDKPIPTGWFHQRIGKGSNMLELYIWNPEWTLAEFLEKYPE